MRGLVKVGVVNYGVGNVGSVLNALRRVGAEPLLVNNAVDLRNADALILPGVGSFNSAVVNLTRLVDELNRVRGSSPILGICLGLQLMFKGSDEG
ncbi:imidazole glycerol phosphate synthase subunit HisH, partial [Caldivirga sp.]